MHLWQKWPFLPVNSIKGQVGVVPILGNVRHSMVLAGMAGVSPAADSACELDEGATAALVIIIVHLAGMLPCLLLSSSA
ncbi:MAG TPA: hypothetical protein VGZ47_05695 [Gemmataceae bacterium]|nr:hypothetical protein [Gemmataceae bacterium]